MARKILSFEEYSKKLAAPDISEEETDEVATEDRAEEIEDDGIEMANEEDHEDEDHEEESEELEGDGSEEGEDDEDGDEDDDDQGERRGLQTPAEPGRAVDDLLFLILHAHSVTPPRRRAGHVAHRDDGGLDVVDRVRGTQAEADRPAGGRSHLLVHEGRAM